MQHTEEDRAFDGELKVALPQQSSENRVDRASLPEPLANQRRTDSRAAGSDAVAVQMRAENGKLLGESSE